MASSIYFDHAATTPCDPRVRAVLLDVLDHENGNPHSTTHEAGMRAADRVAHARNQVASLIGQMRRKSFSHQVLQKPTI